MAVNRASNSRFMGWDGCGAARPDIRRHFGISNFTATLQFSTMLSRLCRATSTIIEGIRDCSYELWKVVLFLRCNRGFAAIREAVGTGSGR